MGLLTFQKPNKFYFFYLAYFIAIFIRQLLNNVIRVKGKDKPKILLFTYILILSRILSFIPYFISRYLSKRKEKSDENKLVANYVYNKVLKKYGWKTLAKPIFILSLFGFFAEIPMVLFHLLSDKIYNDIYKPGIYSILNAVLIYIFAYFIFKPYIYKHHFLSFGINFICFLVSLTVDIVKIVMFRINVIYYYIFVIIRILRLIFHCLLYCYSKKEFESSLLTPFSIIAFRSIYETLFLGIFSIPFTFIPISEFYKEEKEIIFKGFIDYLTGMRLLYNIILLIDDYLIDVFTMLIIDKFSPSHVALVITLESFGEKLYQIINNNIYGKSVPWEVYVNFDLYFLVFIGAMIHNEIFIINKCGLNEKTKLYLDKEFNDENISNETVIII